MRSVYLLLVVIYSATLFASVSDEKRVLNFLMIDDTRSACAEGAHLVDQFPESQVCWEVYIQALSKKGDVKKVLNAWNRYLLLFPDQKENRRILEHMAWGVIEKGVISPSPIVRTYAMLGAFFGQDARGVRLIQKSLRDSNAAIRALALKLSAFLGDADLQIEVRRLLNEDSNVHVRLEAIRAVGQMKMHDKEPQLMQILTNTNTRSEEKEVAMESLVALYETVKVAQVQALANSQRSALRQLACRVVLHTEAKEALSAIFPLLEDSSPDVRQAALETIGYLRIKSWNGVDVVSRIRSLVFDPHPQVAITAAWALTLHAPAEGQAMFEKWLGDSNRDYRLLAASALSSAGKYAAPYLEKAFEESNDRFQRMNLALGLITQGNCINGACEALYDGFTKEQGKWMWEQKGIFRVLAPSNVKYSPLTPNQPEMINQLTRLEILNILTIKDNPYALPAVKHFLNRNHWGITGAASALLLQEGDENAVNLIEDLLNDSSSKVRIQAALTLALWGKGESAVNELQNSYLSADRETKERILEGLGSIGSRASLPFLIERLGEPQPTLRMIAASSLLQCLYH